MPTDSRNSATASSRVTFRKGATGNMGPLGLLSVPVDVRSIAALRVLLERRDMMKPTDTFTWNSYPMAKMDEATTEWNELVHEGSIEIISAAEKDKLAPPTIPAKQESLKLTTGSAVFTGARVVEPAKASPSDADPDSASRLGEAEWKHVMSACNLLSGICIDADKPERGGFPVITSVTPISSPEAVSYTVTDNMKYDAITTHTERSCFYVKNGFTRATFSISSPYASASIEASKQEMSARNKTERSIWSTAKYILSRVTVHFDAKRIAPTEDFAAEIETDLSQKDDSAKRAAIAKTLAKFGHIFPTRVVLGGMLVTSNVATINSKAEERQFESSVGTALLVGCKSVDINAGFVMGGSETKKNESYDSVQTLALSAVGGNTLQATNNGLWVPSVGNYRNWRVIEISEVMNTFDLLPPRLADEVKRLATHFPLEGKWVVPRVMFTDAGSRAKKDLSVYCPDVDEEGWCWLGQSYQNDKVLLVREKTPGSLCDIADFAKVWDDRGSGKERDFNLWDPVPRIGTFKALGGFFQGGMLNQNPPQYDKNLRAVRKDLLIEATVEGCDVWNDAGTGARQDGAIYPIVPVDDQGLNLGFFQAFGKHNNRLPAGFKVWTLRKDAIDIQ
ncbi:hypothetical protein BG011_001642 [Mortierella polycephala]|uniref:MACPF-like domain-containing protein n=1 Tax=Mortierella polycephala TaxID=41804 RepID=A0A9P6TUP5_9FUNG|nr:hypothetical protein BG011_001642 [Mortierella polycephala]